jgi:hypothetical protein
MKIFLSVAAALAVMLNGCVYTTPTITNFQSVRVLPDTMSVTPSYSMMTKSDRDIGFERHKVEIDVGGSIFNTPILIVGGFRILGTVDAIEYNDYAVAAGQYLHFIPIKDIVALGYCWYWGVRLRDAPEDEFDTFGTTNQFNLEAYLTIPVNKNLDFTLIPQYIVVLCPGWVEPGEPYWYTTYAAINIGAGIGGTFNKGKFVIRPEAGYLRHLYGDNHHFAFGIGVTFYPR